MAKISRELAQEMFRRMVHARAFEEKVSYFFSRGMVHGTTHLSMGQEATGVCPCMALNDDDLITSTHRGHSQVIGKGVDLNKMMAELLGKYTGYCKGKGGSMHIADLDRGNLGANGVVGGGHALAVGAALTQKYKKSNKIVLCFFGDGAANEGSFHEALNLASVWELPVIFFCENNLYAMSNPTSHSMNIKDIAIRAASYGMEGHIVDGNNPISLYLKMRELIEKVRRTNKPILVEAKTYRWLGHSKSDAQVYRTKKEVESWKRRDPILQMKRYMIENKLYDDVQVEQFEKAAKEDIEKAVKFANESENPPLDTLLLDVYA